MKLQNSISKCNSVLKSIKELKMDKSPSCKCISFVISIKYQKIYRIHTKTTLNLLHHFFFIAKNPHRFKIQLQLKSSHISYG